MGVMDALGIFVAPLTFSFVLVMFLGIGSAWRLFRSGASADPAAKVWVDAILFWGGFALITGALGAVTGVVRALQGYEAAGEFASPLVAPGLVMFTLSLAVGLGILAIAALLWFVLQLRWRLLDLQRARRHRPS